MALHVYHYVGCNAIAPQAGDAVTCHLPSAPQCRLPSAVLTACRQVWTYKGRVAFVLSITEKGMPVVDGIKLQRLRQLVLGERAAMLARLVGTGFVGTMLP